MELVDSKEIIQFFIDNSYEILAARDRAAFTTVISKEHVGKSINEINERLYCEVGLRLYYKSKHKPIDYKVFYAIVDSLYKTCMHEVLEHGF